MTPFPAGTLALAAALAALPARAAERAYVLDRENPSLTALDLPGLAVAANLPLEGRPEALARTPDGRTLLVLDQGPGKDKGDAGYQATGRSAVTIVDAAALKARARVELGFGLLGAETPTALLSPDGTRLAVVCPGYEAGKPEESLPRELVIVDLVRAEVAGRLPLDAPVTAALSDRETASAYLFTPRRGGKDGTPARVTFVDLAGPRLTGVATLADDPQPPVASPDGRFLYLLDPGRPHHKPDRHVAGTLQVVSVPGRSVVAALDAGSAPRALTPDPKSGLVFFVNDAPPTQGLDTTYGELRVLRGAALATTIQTAPGVRFLRFSAAGDRLYTIAKQGLHVTALPGLQSHPIHLDRAKGVMLEDDPGPVVALGLAPDAKRAFVFHDTSNRLLVLDLGTEESVATLNFGRGPLPRVLKPLGLGTLVPSTGPAVSAARAPFLEPNAVGPRASAIEVRPDSRFAYVLNAAGDVRVVDAVKGTLVERMGGAGKELRLLPGGKQLAVPSDDAVALVDVSANRKGPEVPVKSLRALVPTADESAVMAVGDSEVVLIDAATGQERGRAGGFKRTARALFAAAP